MSGLACVRLSPECSEDGSTLAVDDIQVVRCTFAGGHEIHSEMPTIAWAFFLRNDACAVDDDACLRQRDDWGDQYDCATSSEWCVGDYAGDMRECCPATCGYCDATSEPEPDLEATSEPEKTSHAGCSPRLFMLRSVLLTFVFLI